MTRLSPCVVTSVNDYIDYHHVWRQVSMTKIVQFIYSLPTDKTDSIKQDFAFII